MDDNNLNTITVKVTRVEIDGDNCVRLDYQYSQPTHNPSTVVETYTPSPIFAYSEFDSYITEVKMWAANQPDSGPGSRPIPNPVGWSPEELIGYIRMFNNDISHPAHIHQFDANFQTQLENYVINILPENI